MGKQRDKENKATKTGSQRGVGMRGINARNNGQAEMTFPVESMR